MTSSMKIISSKLEEATNEEIWTLVSTKLVEVPDNEKNSPKNYNTYTCQLKLVLELNEDLTPGKHIAFHLRNLAKQLARGNDALDEISRKPVVTIHDMGR